MAADGIHTPFAGGAPGGPRPPRIDSLPQMSREPSGAVPGVFLGANFDEMIPAAPSLDAALLQYTQGLAPGAERPPATGSGALPSLPSRMFTLSVGKSLSAMASLDLSWLGDGNAAAQQAAAATAAAGGGGAPDSAMPDAPPMPPYLTSHTVAPDPVRVPYPGTPTQAVAAPPPLQPPAPPSPAAAPAGGMDAVHAALLEVQTAYWRALEAHSAGQGLHPAAAVAMPGAAGAPPPTDLAQQWALQPAFVSSMVQQQAPQGPWIPPPGPPLPPLPAEVAAAPGARAFVPFPHPQVPSPPSAARPFPVYVPTDIGPPRTLYEARADAMAQWARERALMAAMTGSSMGTAVRAMAETAGGAGGAGAAPAPGSARPSAAPPPIVHLTRGQPAIKVACPAPPSPRDPFQ